MKLLGVVVLFASLCRAQPVPSLPFPFPFCASTTTISLGGTYTATSTSTVTSITIPPIIPTTCPSVPTITILPPTISNTPCTRVEGDFSVITSIITTTTTGISTTTSTPISTQTIIETWIQPTPTAYNGLNYYQYLNGYNYNGDSTGLGGGGFATADWNGNLSYYTSGLTENINFESPNWPTGAANCQLPGQASATDCSQWTVAFQGFLFASIPGSYEIYSPVASETSIWQDNAGFWWGGDKAYSDYADGNVDGAATPLEIEGVSNRYTYNLEAGEFLPFTWIFANGQGPAANRARVTGPDGVVHEGLEGVFVPPCEDSAFVP
ncbi:hypothetical protein BDV19DRAFT_396660 [Aspergillus venezuelensis]